MTDRQKTLLSDRAYLKQIEVAELLGVSRQSVARELKKQGVERTRFGYLTSDVVRALRLTEFKGG